MGHGASLVDVLIALLQSMVVLLLASGVYIALAVRKTEDSPESTDAKPAAVHRGPRGITSRAG
jgi:Tfp pilus assembly protein PilW